MNRPIPRVVAAAILTLAAWAVAALSYEIWLCPAHRAWSAMRAGTTSMVVVRGERQRRLGDEVLVCQTPHWLGPVRLHEDLDCYCAPAWMSVSTVSAQLDGSCVLDDPLNGGGRCAAGRCSSYVIPTFDGFDRDGQGDSYR